MIRKMLLNVRERAERLARAESGATAHRQKAAA